jgi:hypothetical protein
LLPILQTPNQDHTKEVQIEQEIHPDLRLMLIIIFVESHKQKGTAIAETKRGRLDLLHSEIQSEEQSGVYRSVPFCNSALGFRSLINFQQVT